MVVVSPGGFGLLKVKYTLIIEVIVLVLVRVTFM